ncbi:hypothetical protein JYQ62_24455 [Nostoc sp. UHCC 0702]|nr:hypothetical protein JYQ62_24455 [Nostoc sp. UHCC 0702]
MMITSDHRRDGDRSHSHWGCNANNPAPIRNRAPAVHVTVNPVASSYSRKLLLCLHCQKLRFCRQG